jgi:hypothetical protein
MTWREFVLLSLFMMLLGAAMTANLSDGHLSNMKGSWIVHALR